MVKVGEFNDLEILRFADFGAYLNDEGEGILLPKRFVPAGVNVGDKVKVFIYHDSEDRIIATTLKPKGIVGDIVRLKVVSTTQQGAFLDWGLMKDLFVPRSQQLSVMRPQGEYLVMIYIDPQSGRAAATERIESFLNNEVLTVKELEEVKLTTYRKTDIGYVMIINNKHTGILHFNEVYRNIQLGDTFQGFIKKIYADNRIDVVAGKSGYGRVEGESEKILRLLEENNGYLPYYDKSEPDEIYEFFGMSKKTFKMTIGNLYRQKKISLEKTGIKLV